MNKLIGITIALVIGLATASYADASYGSIACQPIYGGGQTCESASKFVLDKKVLNPESTTKGGTIEYVDNLTINDPKYAPGQVIRFELNVTNTGTETLNEMVLTDIMPGYVTFISGPGTYEKSTNTLTLTITNLNPGETRKYNVEGRIVDASVLPANEGITCVANVASVIHNEEESKDNSQFCIEKDGVVVMPPPAIEETPDTGAGLGLIALIPAAIGGMILRRKAK